MNRLSKLVFITLILSLSILGYLPSAFAAIPAIEREALIALYNSTDGDNWTNNSGWKEPPLHTDGFAMPGTEDTWYDIFCGVGNTHVESIILTSNHLNGSIPPELGNLSNLIGLYLSSNQLSGSIPAELGNLANLEYLYLNANQLSGHIPAELGNLASLRFVLLNSNQLIGRIPTELTKLSVYVLNICDNHLYAVDPDLRDFLFNLQSGWEDCQTPPYSGPMPWNPQLLLED
jgi:hypothetical protein